MSRGDAIFRPGVGLRHAADVVLADAGVTANIVIESNGIPVLVECLSGGGRRDWWPPHVAVRASAYAAIGSRNWR